MDYPARESDLNPDDIAQTIAKAIRAQLQLSGHQDLTLADIRDGSLRLEGFLSPGPGQAQGRQIHLGVVDLSSIESPRRAESARGSPPFPPERHDSATNTTTDAPPETAPVSAMQLRDRNTRQKQSSSEPSDTDNGAFSRRKATGVLRPVKRPPSGFIEAEDPPGPRQIASTRSFPQRKKTKSLDLPPSLQPSSVSKLVNGIWEQIYGGLNIDVPEITKQWGAAALEWEDRPLLEDGGRGSLVNGSLVNGSLVNSSLVNGFTGIGYSEMNLFCKKITQASRCTRALEVIVQARWVECFDARVHILLRENLELSVTKVKMMALKQACEDFAWSEKEMRNKMAVWRGYKELKDAGGWVVLVFAGMGIYRFCKYRTGFNDVAMTSLTHLRTRFEVAADTLHPQWRQMLAFVGAPTVREYDGHPHDWVVKDRGSPVTLRQTYLQWDPDFHYQHLDHSVIDSDAWGDIDPRAMYMLGDQQAHVCAVCHMYQSDDTPHNACQCYPNIFGGARGPSPTQVFHTPDGRNNGLIACLPFERGQAVGEFVGLVTKGLRDTDVMLGKTPYGDYQIYQGHQGNHTKFVNHSCNPNSQFERFMWLGTERTILVSKGIEADEEVTVDYSDDYWRHLDKTCLCGSSNCRYKTRRSSA